MIVAEYNAVSKYESDTKCVSVLAGNNPPPPGKSGLSNVNPRKKMSN